jgi:hypothetical protein
LFAIVRVTRSAIFLNKIGSGMHSNPKFGFIGGGIILMPEKKGSGVPFQLLSS